jgi:hypothetical protein
MKIYKAKREGLINYLIIGFTILPIIIFFFDLNNFIQHPFIAFPVFIPIGLLLWIYFDTYYKIENNELIYRSGFVRGKIDILSVKEILKGKTMWSGLKPALATKGLVIKYNKYDEIYVAPESNDEMISDLLKINPEIKISE